MIYVILYGHLTFKELRNIPYISIFINTLYTMVIWSIQLISKAFDKRLLLKVIDLTTFGLLLAVLVVS
jgi:hypothetical protein